MSIELNSKCRTCLSESSTYYQLLDDVEENLKILEMLDCIVPQINIKSTSEFSTLVCQVCVGKLLIGYKFQQLCLESNERLRDLLGISVIETHQKFEKIIDPLITETDCGLKNEIEEGVCIEYAQNEESNSDNDWVSDGCSEFDPDPSICQTQSFINHLKIENCAEEAIDKDEQQMHVAKPEVNLNSKLVIKSEPDETKELESTTASSANIEQSSSKNIFDCKVCGKIFHRSWFLQRHNSVHSLARPYECEICKYRFSDAKIFKAHLFQHKSEGEQNISQDLPEGYKCEVCQRNFISMAQLTRHYKNQHPEVDKYKCDYCNRTFILHDCLLKHINHRHKSDKSVLCQICKRVFESSYALNQHMHKHYSYLCPHCGKTFRGSSNLRRHVERHTGLLKYQCPDCPKRFNCKSDVLKHATSHSNAKPHICDICGSRFTRKYGMQKHKSLHTAERSYKCDQCNMTFKLAYLLKRHMRTHTGEKPYKCKYCERAYSESGDLTKHLRTHVGENTYMCDQCPVAFKYQAELRQHQAQHYKMGEKNPEKPQDISEEMHPEKVELS